MHRGSRACAVALAAALACPCALEAAQRAAAMPPAGSPPVVRYLEIKSSVQNDVLAVDPETYLYYVQTRPSSADAGRWVPYDERVVLEDFRRLWATGFLDDLSVDVSDVPYANGVVGKHITFDIEERQRVKIVDYAGSNRVEQSKIEERLREKNAQVRLDSFIDPGLLQKVRNEVRRLYADKGYLYATVTPEVTPVGSNPKLVHLTFHINEGPRVTIRKIDFVGNTAVSDRALSYRVKKNKPRGFLSFLTGSGTYKETAFEEDAQAIIDYYRDRGYIGARVGTPDLNVLHDTTDGTTRWVELRVPIDEGQRYRVGTLAFEGETVVKEAALRPLFKVKVGEWYSEEAIRKGLEKAREIFGAGGYMEFTGYPDLKPRPSAGGNGAPLVDVTMRLQEGKQYFVNRITFTGNATTHDTVIRREVRLYEAGVFNTEALKFSIKRLNQLGYFKPLDGEAISVEKTPGADNKVDVMLKLEEQNRNQLMFGAGVSQYEGMFGNLSYTTTNFLGHGESATVSAQIGVRATNYQVAFTEPYLFDRPLTAGISLFSRKVDYLAADGKVGYSEVSAGSEITLGWGLASFTRLFGSYGYEVIDTAIRDDLLNDGAGTSPGDLVFNPFLDEGRHIESRFTPSLVYNTVDNPIAPRSGIRFTGTFQVAGGMLGGTMDYIRPEVELVLYRPVARRMAIGLRGETGWVRPYGDTDQLPYYRRFFLGGETQIRGVNIRTVGPMDSQQRALGGDKYVLFNAEYYFDIAGPVRALLFHDAGQAFLETEPVNLRQLRTSSGAELRVFVPMLNIPFRLIYAWNIYRDSFQPARTFKFAVGSTF